MNLAQATVIVSVFSSQLARLLKRTDVSEYLGLAEDVTTEPHVIVIPLRGTHGTGDEKYVVRAFYMGTMLCSVGRLHAVPTALDIMGDNTRDELARLANAS